MSFRSVLSLEPRHSSTLSPVLLQRKCSCDGSHDECEECREKNTLQRSAFAPDSVSSVPSIVHEVLRSPGRSLDLETRSFMEERFGHDFGRVRVHTDSRAAESAQAVHARAYTVGRDIVFGSLQYSPQTFSGRELLAHELSHVLQQGKNSNSVDEIALGAPGTLQERQADSMAADVMLAQGSSLNAHSAPNGTLQRQGMGELRLAEARMAEEERIAGGCPVTTTGTLSDVSWGETSGIYPTKENKYSPDKWDPAKTCELLKARSAIHLVAQRGEKVKRSKPGRGAIEQKLKPYHFLENFLSVDSEVAGDLDVKWFYLSKFSAKPKSHPAVPNSQMVKSYGAFYNIGGGDVPRGDVYIHFYKFKTGSK